MTTKYIALYDTRDHLIGKLDWDVLAPDRDGNEVGNCYIPQVGTEYRQDCLLPDQATRITVTYRVPRTEQGDECGNLDGINWRAKAYKAALTQ